MRDTLYQEDKSQVRTRSGPRIMAGLRNLAIGALRMAGRTDVTEATRWAGRSMDRALHHPRTHIMILERPWHGRRRDDAACNEAGRPAAFPGPRVNLGKLGFLAEVDVPDLASALSAIDDHEFTIEPPLAVDAVIGGRVITAFNDVAVVRFPGQRTAVIAVRPRAAD